MIVALIIKRIDMARNLDLTALRAFSTVAGNGGVTRAAGLLNLTQSAVSMQIKRLEDSLGQSLFSRASRKLSLTPEGDLLLDYARKMLALNDEALSRLTDSGFEGELRLGVPCDIVYPHVPRILKALAQEFPRLRVNLVSSFTTELRSGFARGEFDVILTTEDAPGPQGEVLARREMVWVGAPDGVACHRRPLRLGFVSKCIFRKIAQQALEQAGLAWEMTFDGDSEQVVEATVAADLAITARMRGALPEGTAVIEPMNVLPVLGHLNICLYVARRQDGPFVETLLAHIRNAYGAATPEQLVRAAE
jgi:DNA-binding transcriptional LysR family regulator